MWFLFGYPTISSLFLPIFFYGLKLKIIIWIPKPGSLIFNHQESTPLSNLLGLYENTFKANLSIISNATFHGTSCVVVLIQRMMQEFHRLSVSTLIIFYM